MANWEHGNPVGPAAAGGIEINGKVVIGLTVRGSLNLPILVGRLPQPLHQLCQLRLLPITSITTKTPIGKGAHVLHRQVQPTEWSRKSGLAGRDITDIRAYELSHRGLGDFSFRLLSEGRHQSIVWARSGSEVGAHDSSSQENSREQCFH